MFFAPLVDLDACVLIEMFNTPCVQELIIVIPRVGCFVWYTIDDDTRAIFRNSNLDGYFELSAWGANVREL